MMRTFVRAAGALALAAAALFYAAPAMAQGVTTAAVRGRITDQSGAPVVAATVVLTNTSTGQTITVRSRSDGRYDLENVPVGGPYSLEVKAIGFEPVRKVGFSLSLGQALELPFTMNRAAVTLETIRVTAAHEDSLFSPNHKGAETMVSDTLLRRLPTLDRQFTDFVALTPQAAQADNGGVSVAGQNNRFNTIQIDGSTVNDRFGLGSTGLTGGQANGRAIGLDAVREYQILLAPYDVRKGNFTGALINAVTKSGTNEYKATGFFYYRNQSLAGDPLSLSDFHQSQFGASIGGPLVKNKAFFFVDAEFRKASAPAAGPYIGQSVNAGVPLVATQGDIDAFNAALQSYGLPTGTGALVNNPNPLANLFFRLDFSVGSNSRLVLRYLYNSADDNIFSRSASSTFPTWSLSNAGYSFKNRTNNPGIQFFTNFANGASNELLFSLNRIRDARDPNVLSPLITVGGFANAVGTGTYSLRSGSEQYSQGNRLNQDIWELTDNFTIPKGTHQITIGTRNELYKVYNLFAQSSYGVWSFDNLADFQNGVASRYQVSGDLGNTGIAATFTEATVGLYAQDNWQATPTFNLTYGLRVDIPIFFDQPNYADSVLAHVSQLSSGLNANLHIPSGQLLFGPRVGFNWDVNGDQVNQIRGGAGLFTGTPAFVWMSNAFSNNGTKLGQLTCGFGNTPVFNSANANYANPPLACANGTGLGTTTVGEVDVIGKNTKYPQVLRANLAYDRRLPGNMVFTLEGIYTRGINDYFITNDNLGAPVGTNAHGRVMYGTYQTSGRSTTDSYLDYSLFGPSYNGGVFDLRNTSKNYSWSVTGQLQKTFSNSWSAMIAYTFSRAYDVQSFTSSRAISNWLYGWQYSGDQTVPVATRSSFDRPNRIVASATYTFPWKQYATDISISYIGQSGTPYVYIATGASGRGDLNADGTNANDPIYIPTDATNTSEMIFQDIANGPTAAQQAAAFNQFISGESCLQSQRGHIMERNSCHNPWQNFLNLSIRQTLPHIGQNKLALEVGIFNVLNLLDKKWGVVKTAGGVTFNDVGLLDMVGATAAQQPIFQFDTSNLQNRFSSISSANNSYLVQLGIRYSY